MMIQITIPQSGDSSMPISIENPPLWLIVCENARGVMPARARRESAMEATVRRPLAALILAAGVSSRMERFKPMLPVGEDTMIRRTVRMMQQAGADPIVVVTGYKSDVLRQHLDGMGLVFLNNEHYASTQMFDSFKIGLEYLLPRCERLLFSPGDVPTVQIDTVRRLLEYDAQVVRPVYGKKSGHPIVLRHDALEKISDYRGEDGLRGAMRELGLSRQDVPVNDEGVVLDADTPEEYNRLLLHNLRIGGGQESLRLDLQLHLCALDSVFDPFFAQLLEMVRRTGSLQMACHAVHISYSKGWKLVRRMEAALGFPLLARVVGGSAGGGSQLTAEGADLLHCYQQMEKEVLATAKESFERCMARYLQLQPAEPEEK